MKLSRQDWAQALSLIEASRPQPPDFIDEKFPCQKAFLLDPSSLIVVLCTRRAAKSFSAAKRLLRAAYKHPGSSCLYIGITRSSAQRALWKDTLKVLNRTHGLGIVFNETELSARLPNGSVIYLLGVDSDEEQKSKLLGGKYAEVVVDEAASFTIDVFELVFGVLKPAVADYRGAIVLAGTPANLKKGLFFDLTNNQDPGTPGHWRKDGWSGHRWNTTQNPYMAEKWAAEIAELKAANPGIEETPLFQQHYLGRWTIDESALVYRYLQGRNDYDGTLPSVYGSGSWHHTLAIDLGFNDATAFSVSAYHDNLKTLFFLLAYKKTGLDITATSGEAENIKSRFEIETTVIDGANKQAVEELNKRHGLEAVPADKTEKASFIDMMNAEYILGRIKLSPDCQDLKDEYPLLIWDKRKLALKKREEHPSCKNDASDTALYNWRHCYQYLATAPDVEPPRVNTPDWYAAQQAEQLRAVEDAFEQQMEANRRAEQERNAAQFDGYGDEQWA